MKTLWKLGLYRVFWVLSSGFNRGKWCCCRLLAAPLLGQSIRPLTTNSSELCRVVGLVNPIMCTKGHLRDRVMQKCLSKMHACKLYLHEPRFPLQLCQSTCIILFVCAACRFCDISSTGTAYARWLGDPGLWVRCSLQVYRTQECFPFCMFFAFSCIFGRYRHTKCVFFDFGQFS